MKTVDEVVVIEGTFVFQLLLEFVGDILMWVLVERFPINEGVVASVIITLGSIVVEGFTVRSISAVDDFSVVGLLNVLLIGLVPDPVFVVGVVELFKIVPTGIIDKVESSVALVDWDKVLVIFPFVVAFEVEIS